VLLSPRRASEWRVGKDKGDHRGWRGTTARTSRKEKLEAGSHERAQDQQSAMKTSDTATTVEVPVRLDFERHAPDFFRTMMRLDAAARKELDSVSFDQPLRELVRIRASQLNGCAYCIDMHTKDARTAGETEQRIYALPAWEEAPYFTERERAALAFTESVTLLAGDHVPQNAYNAVAQHFTPEEVAALVSLIVTINAWNALAVSTRAWTPGSYEP
jgi:AhpD family alkylhydroperoxidase